jgi:DNA modification methylase
MNSNINQLFCKNVEHALLKLSQEIDLSIIKPPRSIKEKTDEEYLEWFGYLMRLLATKTKPGGICCLILDEYKNENVISMIPTKLFSKATEKLDKHTFWEKQEEIIWVKSSRPSSIDSTHNGFIVDFEQNPFATVHVLERKEYNFEYVDSEERVSKLKIDDKIKEAWIDSIWFIESTKEQLHDLIPVELITRLVRIFSNKSDLIFEPFIVDNATAIVCKENNRNFYSKTTQTKYMMK